MRIYETLKDIKDQKLKIKHHKWCFILNFKLPHLDNIVKMRKN